MSRRDSGGLILSAILPSTKLCKFELEGTLINYKLRSFFSDWSKSAHDFFHELWLNGLAEEAGITMIACYRLTTDPDGTDTPCWKDVVFGFRMLTDKELDRVRSEHGRPYTGGNHFVTFCCEPTKFLPYLMKRFLAAGGRIEKRKVLSLDEFNNADLIVNCTGLGSKDLTKDSKFQAIRGQIRRVKAPWIYEVLMHEDDDGNYIIPNTNDVILGGTHQVNDFNLKVSQADTAFIANGCQKLYPSLKNAAVIGDMVGLRPGRQSVRLETEIRVGKPTVVHNVGHGGCGVTLCWGCADDVLIEAVKVLNKSKL